MGGDGNPAIGSKFIANLKSKGNRNEVNTVLEKYDLNGSKKTHL